MKTIKLGAALAVAALVVANSAQAQTAPDPNTIITSASSAATVVMGLCVTVGTFFTVYKVAKWLRK